jgi:hypothetical protein
MSLNNRSEERGRKPEKNSRPGMPADHKFSSPRQENSRAYSRMNDSRKEYISRLRDNDLYERQSF